MIDVVVRCRNDISLLPGTLDGLTRQDEPLRIVAFDNASTDGSRELLGRCAQLVFDVPEGGYVPGRILNQAMATTDSELVAFLNSDCEPLDGQWLTELVAAMDDPKAAAGFGRQLPRRDCLPWFARDTEDTFGDGSEQSRWRHCFSMASSIVRRSAWAQRPFSETIQYSEDIEWTYAMRQRGWSIPYAPESRVYHSHNYSWKQYYRRQRGEGVADATIFDWSPVGRSWLRYSLLPYLRQIAKDTAYCIGQRRPGAIAACPAIRLAQLLGRWQGFKEGLRSCQR